MSAICGILDLNGQRVAPDAFERMMASLASWGGDDRGTWRKPPVAFGHVMLHSSPESLLERLPRESASGELAITADARIDNRADLFRELGTRAAEQVTTSDSDLILDTYRAWGGECVRRLVGDFAFAIWDSRARTLFCARDHFGHRPFFYHRCSRFLAFASAIKGLRAMTGVPRTLNEERIADFLVDLKSVAEDTFYRSILRLPPASTLTVTGGAAVVRRYWSPEEIGDVRLGSAAAYADGVRQLLDEAVRCRLRQVRPVGIFLSGGLDSSSVACVAARRLRDEGRPLLAFTSVPAHGMRTLVRRGWVADERRYVEAVAQQEPNLAVHFDCADGLTPLSGLDRSFRRLDRPQRAASNRHWIEGLLRAAQQRGVGLILTGQSGNFGFSWSGAGYLASLARSGRWRTLRRELRALSAARGRRMWRIVQRDVVTPLVPARAWRAYTNLRSQGAPWRDYSAISPAFARRIDVHGRFQRCGEEASYRPTTDSRRERCRLLASESGDIWAASGAAFGCYVSDPTSDKRLVEFCLGIPDDQFLRDGQERSLARRAMEPVVPPLVRCRTTRGIQGADRLERLCMARVELQRDLDRLERSSLARDYLDVGRMRRVLDTLPDQRSWRWNDQPITTILLRGVMLGRFLLWIANDDDGRKRTDEAAER